MSEKRIMYRAGRRAYGPAVGVVVIERETPKTLVYREVSQRDGSLGYSGRALKSDETLFDTFDEAHEEAVRIARMNVKSYEDALQTKRDQLAKLEALTADDVRLPS